MPQVGESKRIVWNIIATILTFGTGPFYHLMGCVHAHTYDRQDGSTPPAYPMDCTKWKADLPIMHLGRHSNTLHGTVLGQISKLACSG